ISLRRLPPPIAHVALDHAGFDPERFGLLGMLRIADGGYDVVLPRATHHIEHGRERPVAVPVTPLENADDGDAAESDQSRWVLLGATGQRDTLAQVSGIAFGLLLLLVAIYLAVRAFTINGFERPSGVEEKAIAAGLAALLGLVLTRVTVGARVSFFDPFLARGIETAVGLSTAIAVVVVGLLTWKSWLPPFLAGARCMFAGQLSAKSIVRGVMSWCTDLAAGLARSRARLTLVMAAAALTLLTMTTGGAPWFGLLTGIVVVLVWVCHAWIAAFTGDHYDTFERGAHAVVEQLSPARPERLRRGGAVGGPTFAIIAAAFILVLAHALPGIALLGAILMVFYGAYVIRQRRRDHTRQKQPDHVAAGVGVAVFAAVIAGLRLASSNGSVGAFVLVVFVALASVRIGRTIGARLATRDAQSGSERNAASKRNWLVDSVLLVTPLLMLLPFAALDMGLVLVLVIPLAFATVLAAGVRATDPRVIGPVVALLVVFVVGKGVVFPETDPIRDAASHTAQAAAFSDMSELFGVRLPMLATPMDRAAARSVATADPELAERLLVAAGPGPARDLLIPSIEQIWGARAYAHAGWWGEG
ncbi:MAG: hypothetical protein ACREKM_00460, partial [Longimicrobiales bacterium]